MLGDVIVSLDTAARQAAEKKHALDREITMLLAHGLLHLLGFDHTKLTYRFQGRDFRLTDVSGEVVHKLLA